MANAQSLCAKNTQMHTHTISSLFLSVCQPKVIVKDLCFYGPACLLVVKVVYTACGLTLFSIFICMWFYKSHKLLLPTQQVGFLFQFEV